MGKKSLLLFFFLSRTVEPVPVPVTGVRYSSLLSMCTLNTDLTLLLVRLINTILYESLLYTLVFLNV